MEVVERKAELSLWQMTENPAHLCKENMQQIAANVFYLALAETMMFEEPTTPE